MDLPLSERLGPDETDSWSPGQILRISERGNRPNKMEEPFDVCVVGAGPAGSLAAAELAAAGVRTLLVDRADFPRDKVCGDGVSPRAVRILKSAGLYQEDVFSRFSRIEGVRIRSPEGSVLEVSFRGDEEIGEGYVIPRKVFDQFLLQEALRRGAEFRGCCEVDHVESGHAHAHIQGTCGGLAFSARCRHVVAAWGAQGGRLSANFPPCPKASLFSCVAVRAHYEGLKGLDPFMEIHFDRGLVPGYGWVFPTGPDSANVGYGMRLDFLRRANVPLKVLFERFLKQNPAVRTYMEHARRISPLRGARIPFRRPWQPVVRGRILLAGDAAGFADPLSGEGIGTALQSGLLAARSVSKALASPNNGPAEAARLYRQACRIQIQRDLLCALFLQSVIMRPRVTSTEKLLNLFVEKGRRNARMGRAIARIVIGDLPKDVILRAETWKKLVRALIGS